MDDRILGAIYGALVGDAFGGVAEFVPTKPIPDSVLAMADNMKGGGVLGLAPGQITDDGELTICLLHALSCSEEAAIFYHKWFQSNPIDCGLTCRGAFDLRPPYPITNARMMAQAAHSCMKSQSNGALMRSSPIGAIGAQRGWLETQVAEAARTDARISHPNPSCVEACAGYSTALSHLISNPGDAQGALEAALRMCGSPLVRCWLLEVDPVGVAGREMTAGNMGWVRWGLSLAFYHLRNRTSYQDALRETVRLGGDTDTIACIVGGLIGALHGVEVIPLRWLDPVLQCKARPEWLRPARVKELLGLYGYGTNEVI